MESKASLLIDSKDPLDDPNFDPVAFINEKFPTEQSLTGLEDFKQSLKKQLDELDQEILQEVRKQACSSEQAKTSLQEANELIRELCKQISEMKDKASTSEQMVQEICRDIRTLDIAKRNLVTAITALKRLYMLENGLEELKNVINSKHYKLATSLVDATSTLLQTFQECQHLEKIKQLKDERNVLCQLLRQKLIQDFQSELTEPKTLQEACVAAEALGYEIQQELVGLQCMKQLEPYRLLFNPGQSDSGFEAIDRRFAWLARRLREFRENRANLFPEY